MGAVRNNIEAQYICTENIKKILRFSKFLSNS